MFPAINAERFGGSPVTLGLLGAAPAVGGVIGAALSGPIGGVVRQGAGMLVAGSIWGIGIAAFGVAHQLWWALAFLAVAGAADVLSVVLRTTLLAARTPDRVRGRVGSVEYVVGAACPQLGNFRAGAVASLAGTTASAVSGGMSAALSTVLLAWSLPQLRRQRAGSAPPAPAAPPAPPESDPG